MASGPNSPPGSRDGPRRRRPPTIDLEATEIDSRLGGEERVVREPEPPAPAPEDQSGSSPRDAGPATQGDHAAEPRPPESQSADRPYLRWLPEELSWQHVGAGAAGAAGGLLAFLVLWLLGASPSGRDSAAELGPRLAVIERQLNELAARPAAPSADPRAVEELASRLGRIEAFQATPRPPVTDPVVLGRLSATESAAKSTADNVAALSRRIEELTSRLGEANQRLEAMAARLSELQRTTQAAGVGSDRVVRLALAASALRAAVERGDPFVTELAVAKPLTANPATLAPLEPFAATGVPTEWALARELAMAIEPMQRRAGAPPRGGSFFERLQANAEKLVRIRPIEEAPGDDRAAILARVESRAAQGSVEGALAELQKLAPADRAPLEPWIARAQARKRAVETIRTFAADAMAALKATP